MDTWNAGQYLKFATERTRPCRDLAARVLVDDVRRVIDLGCGPGNSTEVLASLWPGAVFIGLDSSPQMIESARQSHPDFRWIVDDISSWAASESAQYDIVFSNAALQWLPDHAAAFPPLFARVAPAGALAAQMPGNLEAPQHRLMRELAESPAWRDRFPPGPVRSWYIHDLSFYYDLLAPLAARVDFWETEYLHIMPSAEGIVEWYKGTGLRPFLDVLHDAAEKERFTAAYLERIRPYFPPRRDGSVLFPFRRVFLIAYAR